MLSAMREPIAQSVCGQIDRFDHGVAVRSSVQRITVDVHDEMRGCWSSAGPAS
jgi:hypothetical protein